MRRRLLSPGKSARRGQSQSHSHRTVRSYPRWRNTNARHSDAVAAQRRQRARVGSDKGIRWSGCPYRCCSLTNAQPATPPRQFTHHTGCSPGRSRPTQWHRHAGRDLRGPLPRQNTYADTRSGIPRITLLCLVSKVEVVGYLPNIVIGGGRGRASNYAEKRWNIKVVEKFCRPTISLIITTLICNYPKNQRLELNLENFSRNTHYASPNFAKQRMRPARQGKKLRKKALADLNVTRYENSKRRTTPGNYRQTFAQHRQHVDLAQFSHLLSIVFLCPYERNPNLLSFFIHHYFFLGILPAFVHGRRLVKA